MQRATRAAAGPGLRTPVLPTSAASTLAAAQQRAQARRARVYAVMLGIAPLVPVVGLAAWIRAPSTTRFLEASLSLALLLAGAALLGLQRTTMLDAIAPFRQALPRAACAVFLLLAAALPLVTSGFSTPPPSLPTLGPALLCTLSLLPTISRIRRARTPPGSTRVSLPRLALLSAGLAGAGLLVVVVSAGVLQLKLNGGATYIFLLLLTLAATILPPAFVCLMFLRLIRDVFALTRTDALSATWGQTAPRRAPPTMARSDGRQGGP